MMDRLAIEAAKAATGPRLAGRRRGAPHGRGRAARRGGARLRARRSRSRARRARSRSACRATRPSGSSCGRGASPRSRRSAASARTTSSRTASSRAPRSRACCARSTRLAAEAGLRVANVFHAGDGNLHPLVLYDARVPGRGGARGRTLGGEILRLCIRYGRLHHRRARRRRREGRLHGGAVRAGRPRDDGSACAARSTRAALINPGKVFPTPRLCGEKPGPLPPAPRRGGGARGALVSAAARAGGRRRRRARRRARGSRVEPGDASTRPPRRCARSRRDRLAVAFVGGGTDLELGAPPARLDAVLAHPRGSTRIREHAPSDQIVAVEAGMTRRRAAARTSRRTGSGSRSTRRSRSARPSAASSRRTRSGRAARATARCATSSSASPSCAPTASSRAAAARW